MGQSKEHYAAHPMGAGESRKCGVSIAGFIATAGGTITVTDADGTVLLNAFPITAAMGFVRIPLLTNTSAGCTVTLGGGAAGTLFT
jgi:hypothetical protein